MAEQELLSDGKYNITTQFGGDLHNYVGTEEAMDLMEYVDQVLCSMGAQMRNCILLQARS